jgi:hypothetical protein
MHAPSETGMDPRLMPRERRATPIALRRSGG